MNEREENVQTTAGTERGVVALDIFSTSVPQDSDQTHDQERCRHASSLNTSGFVRGLGLSIIRLHSHRLSVAPFRGVHRKSFEATMMAVVRRLDGLQISSFFDQWRGSRQLKNSAGLS